jgi:hypothetical protein
MPRPTAKRKRKSRTKKTRKVSRRRLIHPSQKRKYKLQTAGDFKTVTWRPRNDVFGEDMTSGRFRYLNTSPSELRTRNKTSRPLTNAEVMSRVMQGTTFEPRFHQPTDWWDTEKHGDKYTENHHWTKRATKYNR